MYPLTVVPMAAEVSSSRPDALDPADYGEDVLLPDTQGLGRLVPWAMGAGILALVVAMTIAAARLI